MPSEINPYAAPQSDPENLLPQGPVTDRRYRWAIGGAATILLGCAVAAGFAIYDIESIVVSGGILSVLALLLLAIARPLRLRGLMPIALAMLTIALGCFATIYFNSWSPTQAQTPIGTATVVCAVLMQTGWLSIAKVRWSHRESLENELVN
ncbi:hypothetical protein NHH03_21725 [Stieleria sp. TO1_6]|uniref:hypothetical protein n=1 Tax=Stieleria tagensis TaxID=2956795 RepID=UPI00209A6663|nr:hypothetical protein [Stieleria tagensis]MCO8124374.1 hypothetical protein [Stieleria tagensis]